MACCQRNGCRCGCGTASNTTSANSATTSILDDPDFVEDVAMCRYTNTIPICLSDGNGVEAEILAALQCQNQLLVDILGAINSLTAAALSGRNLI